MIRRGGEYLADHLPGGVQRFILKKAGEQSSTTLLVPESKLWTPPVYPLLPSWSQATNEQEWKEIVLGEYENSPHEEDPINACFILDGNRTSARNNGLPEVMGHKLGIKQGIHLMYYYAERGINVGLWVLSRANIQQRTTFELRNLYDLVREEGPKIIADIDKRGMHLEVLGRIMEDPAMIRDKDRMIPADVGELLINGVEKTKDNEGPTIQVFMNYDGRDEQNRAQVKFSADLAAGKILPPTSPEDAWKTLERYLDAPYREYQLFVRSGMSSTTPMYSSGFGFRIENAYGVAVEKGLPETQREHVAAAILLYHATQKRKGK